MAGQGFSPLVIRRLACLLLTRRRVAVSPSALISLVILLSLVLTAYEVFKIFGRDFGRAVGNRFTLLVGFLNLINEPAECSARLRPF